MIGNYHSFLFISLFNTYTQDIIQKKIWQGQNKPQDYLTPKKSRKGHVLSEEAPVLVPALPQGRARDLLIWQHHNSP